MTLETMFNTHAWIVALGIFFQAAEEHQDLDMMQALLCDLQEAKADILTLEDCFDAELDADWVEWNA